MTFSIDDVRDEIRPATQELIHRLLVFPIVIHPIICEDETVTIEWYSKSWRMGFFTDFKPEDSGWYLVSEENLGNKRLLGDLYSDEMYEAIRWGLEHLGE